MEIISGEIVDAGPGYIMIRAAYDNPQRLVTREYREVQIGLRDGRKVTPEQRRKAFALIGEIADFTGYEKDEAHMVMKHSFLAEHVDQLQREFFSLADCDVTTAREYISYLIDFCLKFEVPTKRPLAELCDDIERYVYACLMNKKCAVCGQKAELHHVDRIGMGNDRTKVTHVGRRCLPLCRVHHQEIDSMGDNAFCDRYHIEPVKIDERIVKVYRLRGKKEDYHDRGEQL